MKLPINAQKWLRIFHLYMVSVWGGGASSLFAIHCLYAPDSWPELHARNLVLLYVDNYVLVPSAIGCMLTGLLYCHLTKWGYLTYYWIIGKLIANSLFLFVGYFWFIPWIDRMVESSSAIASRYMEFDSRYIASIQMHMAMIAAQALLVFVLIVISVFKPWGRTNVKMMQGMMDQQEMMMKK